EIGGCRRDRGKSKMTHIIGVVAAPNVDENLASSAADGGLCAHGVRPKPIDLTALQRARCKNAERHIATSRSGQLYHLEIAPRFDTPAEQHLLQRLIRHLAGPYPPAS